MLLIRYKHQHIKNNLTFTCTSHQHLLTTSCFKGLVTGEIIRYWTQNTSPKDFIKITMLFLPQQTIRGRLGLSPQSNSPLILFPLHQQLSVFLSAAQWLCYVHLCT